MSADCCLLMCASPNVQALINATLRPGSILYVPRAYFHETSTASDAIAAPPTYADESFRSEDMGTQEGAMPDAALISAASIAWCTYADLSEDGEPSMALTFAVLSDDVFATWIYMLGEAIEQV